MNLRTIVAAVLIGTALPASALGNNQATFYTEEQILNFDLAGARVGVAIDEIDAALTANGYVRDEVDLGFMSKWENKEQNRTVSTSDFVDLDGVRKSSRVTYTTSLDPEVPVQAIIQNLTDRYGEPSRRLDRGMAWLIDARQSQYDSRPMLSVEQISPTSLMFDLLHRDASKAADDAKFQADMERRRAEAEAREQAAVEAAKTLDLGL